MINWYRSLIPGRMPLWVAWVFAVLGASVLLVWITISFGGGIVIPLQVGDTIRFEQVRQGAGSTKPHFFTVEGLDIDVSLDDGRFGTDPPGGALDLYEITFTEPGRFDISDSAHPGAQGGAAFVVAEDVGGRGRLIVTGAFVVEDDRFELWISETEAQFGYPPGTRVPSKSSAEQPVFLGLIGSVLAAPVIAWAKRRRWWLWGIFGLVGGFLAVVQPLLTSLTVAAAVLLGERPQPASASAEQADPTEAAAAEPTDGPLGPPVQDQRTLPPPTPVRPPPRSAGPRPPRSRRRPRH